MKQQFFYKNIFMYGSLQSVGHTEEYFAAHTEKLVVYIIMPRVQNRNNLLRIYQRSTLTKEVPVWSSANFFLYYASWLFHYWKFILTYFGRSEHFLVFSGHPISFFGMTIQKLLRPGIDYAFWIGDYYPPVRWSLRVYERVKKYYHDRIPYTYYLSDTINQIMNGRVASERNKRTVMWGVKLHSRKSKVESRKGKILRLLFVGVVKESQGLEELFSFLVENKYVKLSVIGVCEKKLYATYSAFIKKLDIGKRVWFPNKFVDDEDLITLGARHDVGIALYEKGRATATHYTDPGKVKTYVELGLPVIMTNTSAIAPYIERFHAGEVVSSVSELPAAIKKIKQHYARYQKGLFAFAKHFEYEEYYHQAFAGFENVN